MHINRLRTLTGLIVLLLLAAYTGGVDPASARAEEEERVDGLTVSEWILRMRYGTRGDFDAAERALRRIGPKAAPAIPHILDDIVYPDDARRKRLSDLLLTIGPDSLPHLMRCIEDWSGYTVSWTLRTLREFGLHAGPTAPVMARHLTGSHPETAEEVARTLSVIGPAAALAIPEVERAMDRPHPKLRAAVCATLKSLGPKGEKVLARLETHADAEVRTLAAATLGRKPPEPDPRVVPKPEVLVHRLLTGELDERRRAANRMRKGVVPAEIAVPALTVALGHTDRQLRITALLNLATYGRKAAQALPVVRMLAEHGDEIASVALGELPRFGPGAIDHIPWVASLLPTWDRGIGAMFALTRYGRPALPHLKQAMKQPSFLARARATRAVADMKGLKEERLPLLTMGLKDRSSDVRYRSANGLGGLGKVAEPSIPDLRKALTDLREGVRVAAARALIATGYRELDVVPALVEGITSRWIGLSEDVDKMLLAVGKPALPLLGKALKERSAAEIHDALKQMGKDAIPALVEGLRGRYAPTLEKILETLREWKAADKSMLEPVTSLLDHDEGSVRLAAARALVPLGARAELAIPALMGHWNRKEHLGGEEGAFLEALEAIGPKSLPPLRALVAKYHPRSHLEVRAVIRRLEQGK